ncbi:MAG: hypothetical protein A2176_03475 [Spirochaetes bacterium RBG_13_51_14]|nr:MAG: hypothetical protein A2176_03475 [Spirochaetes bacterium RBG_13_51_14]
MKKYLWLVVVASAAVASCGLFKKPILMDGVIDEKVRMDEADNPAKKLMIKEELGGRRIQLFDLTVKEVTESTNIDYDFCVIADVQTKKGAVECHIYSSNVKTVSRLVKGKSKIDVTGEFGRFFTLLDNYYTRLEIVKASITIK